ncbi:MAG: Ryanodine receptor Ryr, partial [Muribaculaceae bacterium]|nr:Ryanodine receptor Ryr [Muribaculaceae bacterium]
MKEYRPRPAATDDVQLPAELLPLIEDMAKNVQEVWA